MKKTLLFTIAILGAISFTSAQTQTVTVANTSDKQVFAIGTAEGNITPAVVGDVGKYTQAATYSQLRGTGVLKTELAGTAKFSLQTDGTEMDVTVTVTCRKSNGASLDNTISIDTYTDENYIFPSQNTDTELVSDFYDMGFTQEIKLSDTPVEITVTTNSLDLVDMTGVPLTRLYEVHVTRTDALGLNSIDSQEKGITVYPNPATNSFQLNSTKTIESVQLYNVTGRLLKTFNAKTNYDISDLATGIYIANIKTQSGSKALRIVKK